MYEYDPRSKKTKEKLITLGLLCLAAFLFGLSRVPNLPFPALLQLAAVVVLVVVVLLTTRYLLRRYTYCVTEKENGAAGEPFDFTVTEYYGRRVSVVCRISAADIEKITPVTRENRKDVSAWQKGNRVYDYSNELTPENLYLLTVRDGAEVFYIRICADENLISALKQQYLSF